MKMACPIRLNQLLTRSVGLSIVIQSVSQGADLS